MGRVKRRNLILCLTGIFIVFACWVPVLKYFMRTLMLFATLYGLVFLLFKLPRMYVSRFFWIPMAYFVYRFFIAWIWGYYAMGDTLAMGVYTLLAEVLALMVASGMFLALVASGDFYCFRRFVLVSTFFLALFALFTIKAEIGTARFLGSMDGSIESMQRAADNIMTGTLDYGGIHALPFIMFGSIYAAKSATKKTKIYFYTCGLLFLLAIYRSAFTTATLFGLILAIVALIPQQKVAPALVGMFLLLLLFLVALKVGLVTSALVGIRSLVESEDAVSISGKVDELISISKGLVIGDGATRLQLYTLSWEAFLASPIWGNFDAVLGGHAFLIDYLGREGLIGVGCWCLFYVNYFLQIRKFLPQSRRTPYAIAFMFFIFLISLKAAWMRSYGFVFYLILPSLLLMRENLYKEASYRVRRYLGLTVIPYG